MNRKMRDSNEVNQTAEASFKVQHFRPAFLTQTLHGYLQNRLILRWFSVSVRIF